MATALVRALWDVMQEGLMGLTPPSLCYVKNCTLIDLCVAMETNETITKKAGICSVDGKFPDEMRKCLKVQYRMRFTNLA